MDFKVILNFNRKDFEEIYFKENQGNLLFSSQTKTKTITTLILGILILVTYSNSYSTSNNWGFFYFTMLLFIGSLINLLINVNQILVWKKKVKKYLDDISKCSKYEVIINENYLYFTEDENETIIKWSEIKKIEITENYICLEGSENFLFPKKSMTEIDFQKLKKIIRKNIK